MGLGDIANEAELGTCLAAFTVGTTTNPAPTGCQWFTTPPKPAGARAASLEPARDPAQLGVRTAVCRLYGANKTRACAGTRTLAAP
jgi:hypothetical protein